MKGNEWKKYEQQFALKMKTAMKNLGPLIREAVSTLHVVYGPGDPHS